MKNNKSIKLFNDKNIRVEWSEDEEKWYFSIVDVTAILTEIKLTHLKADRDV